MSITIEKMLALLTYILSVLQIWLAIRFLFQGSFIRKKVWLAGTVLMVLCSFLDVFSSYALDRLGSLLLLVCFLVSVKRPFYEHWSWGIRKYIFLKCQWLVFFQLVMIITYSWNFMEIGAERFCAIVDILSTLWIILLCAVYQFHIRTGAIANMEKVLRRLLVPFLVLIFLEMILGSALYYKTQMDYGSGFHKKLAYVLSIVCVISFSIYALIVFYIRKMNEKIEQMLRSEKMDRKRQILYYEAMLKKEEETRKYRHDMEAHILLLLNMAEENDVKGIYGYLSQMLKHAQEIKNITYNTGIRELDGILHYYMLELKEGTTVKLHGRCDSPLDISDMDFCTVFSNLIRNMVEAVNSSTIPEPFLDIQITEGVLYVEIILENSVDENELHTDDDGNFLTSKKDKKNHGFGIKTTQAVVEKNGGKFESAVKRGKFRCRVILRKKKTEHTESQV